MDKSYLVADIGGTNCRVSSFLMTAEGLVEKYNQEYLTAEISDFKDLLARICGDDRFSEQLFDTVVVAAAGPVSEGGICNPPNINWKLSLKDLENAFGKSKVFLINDFLAQSYAVLTPLIKKGALVKDGELLEKGIIGVIGPGTGLGKSFISINGPQKTVGFPSEGGHVAFPAFSRAEFSFLEFVMTKENSSYVTCEHILSGRVLAYLHEFHYGELLSVSEVGKKLKSQKLELIVQDYSRFLGRVCRDFALEILSDAGIFIAGGVLAKSPELLDLDIFNKEFTDSPTQTKFLKSVRVVNFSSNNSGLWGAAKFASIA